MNERIVTPLPNIKVFARSLEVWGDEEAMEEERERRANAREKRKEKQFDKKVKGKMARNQILMNVLRQFALTICHFNHYIWYVTYY